jgi:tRNA(Phe) wybutosine-synthesizing methylase Tyw3
VQIGICIPHAAENKNGSKKQKGSIMAKVHHNWQNQGHQDQVEKKKQTQRLLRMAKTAERKVAQTLDEFMQLIPRREGHLVEGYRLHLAVEDEIPGLRFPY